VIAIVQIYEDDREDDDDTAERDAKGYDSRNNNWNFKNLNLHVLHDHSNEVT